MGFVGVCKAIYDYAPQAEGELQISEGDLLYVLEKSGQDDWWKAKKKASTEDEDEEEPVGLVPNNYVEQAKPEGRARALFEYTRQTDEELSFSEDTTLDIYDTSDPDWILAGHDGDFGFVPANYIDIVEGNGPVEDDVPLAPTPPALPARTPEVSVPPLPARNGSIDSSTASVSGTAAPLAGVMRARAASTSRTPQPLTLPPRPTFAEGPQAEVRSPPLPARPRAGSYNGERQYAPSPMDLRPTQEELSPATPRTPQTAALTPGGFHMYNINEMVSVMGKKKKMPTTLGINLKTGIILVAPERAQDGPSQEWAAERMTHHSREGKHVFLELVRPSKSFDFHAGAKDTAEEVVAMLDELAGALRAEGLREALMAGGSGPVQKKGVVLYDFIAQGDDEVTVGVGDEVMILDDTKSEEWWQVRRLKNNSEGVVPGSYIEVTETIVPPVVNAGRSTVEQNRLEEQRLAKEALKAGLREDQKERERRVSEVGPGLPLPKRRSSLSARDGNLRSEQRSGRENGRAEASSRSNKSKPDPAKVRTWTDRSKSFSVDAQFLALKDGKIHLHKMNGVKIAVPVVKMSREDLEYVERITGQSLDEDKPLSDLIRKSGGASNSTRLGATIEAPRKPEYDWFQFFLSCEVAVGLCERYAQAFSRDSMDESVLPDVDASVLRTLGLREGDIIKVMRFLDNKYARNRKKDEGEGGLFSGPGGTLKNNTGRNRPAPPIETKNVVDAKALSSPAAMPPSAAESGRSMSGFDDDAWNLKPSSMRRPSAASSQASAPVSAPMQMQPSPGPSYAPVPVTNATPISRPMPPTGPMRELSLLAQPPLEPERMQPMSPQPQPSPAMPNMQMAQATGATPAFFGQMGQAPQQQQMAPTGMARQRPLAPQYTQGQGGLMPPPPARPLSAPQSAQPSAFTPPPLQPQTTGYQPIAPPGQSLDEMAQARMREQFAQQMQAQAQHAQQAQLLQQQQQQQQQQQPHQQPQMMMPMMTGLPPNQMMHQQTGYQSFNPSSPQGHQQFGANINSFLPPPLEPQRTGMPSQSLVAQPTGMMAGFGPGFGNVGLNSMNSANTQPSPIQTLIPQRTGPPPPVRFGVTPEANKLLPQPTGRRANLAQATPQNPFGF